MNVVLMIFSALIFSNAYECDQEYKLSDNEKLFIENGSLFNINDDYKYLLLKKVQGFLFDDERRIIFYKRNGHIYSSVDHAIVSSVVKHDPTLHHLSMAVIVIACVLLICMKFVR